MAGVFQQPVGVLRVGVAVVRLDVAGAAAAVVRTVPRPRALRHIQWRALAYPPALGFSGNPLLLFALDRDTRELSAATGGSAMWFRNRFRHALATAAELRPAEIEHGGRRLPATTISLVPYAGEPRAGRYGERRYAFTLSDAVPGSIHTIRTELPAAAAADRAAVVESITFAGTAPLPRGGAG